MVVALETVVIKDNNPNLLGVMVLILAVVYIVFAIIEIHWNNKKKKRLTKIRKKLIERHELIVQENERRKRIAANQENSDSRTPL